MKAQVLTKPLRNPKRPKSASISKLPFPKSIEIPLDESPEGSPRSHRLLAPQGQEFIDLTVSSSPPSNLTVSSSSAPLEVSGERPTRLPRPVAEYFVLDGTSDKCLEGVSLGSKAGSKLVGRGGDSKGESSGTNGASKINSRQKKKREIDVLEEPEEVQDGLKPRENLSNVGMVSQPKSKCSSFFALELGSRG